jgi:meso-butanediol dehydrogenase / (S,S)-butanediol dehydrogenase / diacetyl reductase
VLAVDFDVARLNELTEAIEREGGTVRAYTADLRARGACVDAVDQAILAFGQLDVLGNIAGFAHAQHVTDVTEEQYRQMMAVNADAYFFLAQASIPHLLASGGNIVNIASNAGFMGQAYGVVYGMTKGAVIQLTRALAMEYVKSGIRVNAIAPAGVATRLVESFEAPAAADAALMYRCSGFRGLAEPEEIANLFAFIASDDGRGFHGSIVAYDRGVSAG